MPRLVIYLLGPPRVERDGEAIHIVRSKVLALLAYLAVEYRRHSRDTLGALLWPELDSAHARSYLRRTLSELNRTLGDGLVAADRKTIGLCPEGDASLDSQPGLWLDVAAFRQHLAACASHGHAPEIACSECQAWLEEAVALYRDDFLAGFGLPDSLAFDEWTRYQTENLRDELAGALERLAETLVAHGQFDDAIPFARRWLSLDPLREAAHRCLMRLYALSGQEPAALRQYQECERTLKDELGVPPSPETVELMERIQTLRAAVPHNLPPQPTPFVGRETELTQLDDLIADPAVRLITIVGPGGIGKTRLALTAAERQLHDVEPKFPDGVYFVPLASLSPSDEMAPVVAEALNFQLGGPGESRSATQRVSAYLREKRMLLVLDNFEHLLSSPPAHRASPPPGASVVSPPLGETEEGERGGVSFVADVLHTAPHLQLLVTSREHLPLREEQVFQISGLDYPDAEPSEASSESDDVSEYASVRLFLQAAGRVQSGFELAPDDLASLAHICRLLEGMPLAIELAATWVDVLSLSDIAAEIQRGLDFLATDWHDVPERHRSVRAAFDATWRRLTDTEQAVFAQLCVFRGGFTREAARGVTGADLRTLARLVNKSLLQFNRSQERYDVHELLRQYGYDRLSADSGQEKAARDRHSAHFCDALGRWGDAMNRGKRLDVGVDFEADWANLRVAWDWAADQGDASRLDLALDGLWYLTEGLGRHQDGEQLFQCAIDGLTRNSQLGAGHTKRVLAKAHTLCCDCHFGLGHQDLFQLGLQQGAALLSDPDLDGVDTRAERARLLVMSAMDAFPDWAAARQHFQQALALQRDLGYQGQVAFRVLNIAYTHAEQGHNDRARRGGEKALRLFKAMGNQIGTSNSHRMLGQFALRARNLREAERQFAEFLGRARESGSVSDQARGLERLGFVAVALGKYDEAEVLLRECGQMAQQAGAQEQHCRVTQWLGTAAWFRGDVDTAESRWNESLHLAHQARLSGHAAVAQHWLSYSACARGDFDRAKALCEEGLADLGERDFDLRALLNLALARVALFRSDPTQALEQFQKCLRDPRALDWDDTISALEGLSWALPALDRYEEAAQLLGFLATDRERTGLVLPPVDQPHHERALNLAREGIAEEAFAAAWEAGAALTLEEAVDTALAA